jgi:hypothetical protein
MRGLLNEFNVAGFMRDPAETLYQGLILAFKPVNMDVLPLYIVLMFFFPQLRRCGIHLRRHDRAGGCP